MMSSYMLTYLTWPPFILCVLLAIVMLFVRRPSSGCFFTVVSAILAVLVTFMAFFGDCFPSATVTCPTDTDRKIMFYSIGLSALVINVVMWIRIGSKPVEAIPPKSASGE